MFVAFLYLLKAKSVSSGSFKEFKYAATQQKKVNVPHNCIDIIGPLIAIALKMMTKRAVIVISNNLGSLYTREVESMKIETSHWLLMPGCSL